MARKAKQDVLVSYDFLPVFETLVNQGKEKIAAELIIAIIKFDKDGVEPSFSDASVELVWESVIRPRLVENKRAYEEVGEKRRAAVNNRYRKNGQNNTDGTNEYKCNNDVQNENVNTDVHDNDNDNDNVNDNVKEKINKKEKPQKHQYGEYKNVLLSDDELQKLQTEFPSDWKERIENVSEYCRSHGKTYKDYLATIRNWARREKQNATRPTPIRKNDVASGYQRMMEILGGNDEED